MADQLFTDGDIKTIDGKDFECVAVSHSDNGDGVKYHFVYSFQLKSELDAQRALQAEQERVNEETEQPINNADAPSEPPAPVASQPEEETQYVK